MSTKTALIVDDSKTAQFKLKRTLQHYDLSIDVAFSAEDALSYLSYRIPDVIFMDHSMRGMNGLEAVKIIKSNPATAHIPISMYTAESGDDYIRQARATGAIDVLSKDIMTDLDVDRVMKHVNVAPLLEGLRPIEHAEEDSLTSAMSNAELIPGLAAVRDQVASSMDIQQRRMRREIHDNTRVLINRFMREFRLVREDLGRHQKQQQGANNRILSDLQPKTQGTPRWVLVCIGLLSALALFSMLETIKLRQAVNELSIASKLANTESSKQLTATTPPVAETNATTATLASNTDLTTQINELNQQSLFSFNEQALANDRVELISNFIEILEQKGFIGTLSLEIHHGNFCGELDANGNFTLPASEIPMTECKLISEVARNYTSSIDTSIEFANALNTFEIIDRGDLRVDIIALGVSAPIYQYPPLNELTNSSEWNTIATSNNRVTASIQRR